MPREMASNARSNAIHQHQRAKDARALTPDSDLGSGWGSAAL